MKHVTITFDYEGTWGMPHTTTYDLPATTDRLLAVLSQRNAKAVFFVSSKLIGEHPAVIRRIHDHGHEIGFHGYAHEHMHELTADQLAELAKNLAQTAIQLREITGYAPKGFRAPYLMGPVFYVPPVYRALAGQGFTWISNREIRMPEELFRPDRIKFGLGLLRTPFIRKPLLAALNPNIVLKERPDGGPRLFSGLRWLLGNQLPFRRPEGLLEFPLTSPLDCDLVGLPLPSEASGKKTIAYATRVITDCYDISGPYFNINCHDWIMGSQDRLQILDDALAYINASNSARYYLPGSEKPENEAGK